MAWSDNPKIRDLEPYAKKHGYAFVVLYAVREDRQMFEVNTYGRNAGLCKVAGLAGDQIADMASAGTWPTWPATEPAAKAIDADEARRHLNYLVAISKLAVKDGLCSGQAVTYARKALGLEGRTA